jgi:predicted metallo-beta-lactamase superfamily hydrolase
MNNEMKKAVDNLLEAIKNDYINWTSSNGKRELTEINKNMISEFCDNLTYKVGKKYIKIVKGDHGSQSVWGFVVNTTNDKKFREGDILKAASWATPARNHARGNVFEDEYSVQWTSPHYM